MKKLALAVLVVFVAVAFVAMGPTNSFAQQQQKKIEKFGEDKRIQEWSKKKFETSNQNFQLRMSDPWGGLNFHDMAIHFADTVRACSGGRLNIKVFPTGAIVPAMEIFEATSKGTLDAFHSWPGYWKGRNEAFVAYASVPFGLDNEGYNIWYYERGGKAMFDELYGRFGMVPFFCGNVGKEIGMHSNKRAMKLDGLQRHEGAHRRLVHGHPDQDGRLRHPAARSRNLSGARARRHRRRRVQLAGRQHPLRFP